MTGPPDPTSANVRRHCAFFAKACAWGLLVLHLEGGCTDSTPDMVRFLPHCALALLPLVATGCRDREITSYRAPRDPAPKQEASAPGAVNPSGELPPGHPPIGEGQVAPAGDQATMASTPVATAGGRELVWTAPAGWTPKPGSSVRRGSYAVTGTGGEADFAITAFPGDTGGLAANLNRWRGQIGLPAQPAAEVLAAIERFNANGLEFTVVDYTGPDGTRVLGAVVPFEANTWFFKLTGPSPVVGSARPAFLELLHTVKAP